MKKIVKEEIGVVAEYKGKYWCNNGERGNYFGDIENADISNPQFCKKPTDLTYDPKNTGYNPDYVELSKAKLVKIKKTITTEIEIL